MLHWMTTQSWYHLSIFLGWRNLGYDCPSPVLSFSFRFKHSDALIYYSFTLILLVLLLQIFNDCVIIATIILQSPVPNWPFVSATYGYFQVYVIHCFIAVSSKQVMRYLQIKFKVDKQSKCPLQVEYNTEFLCGYWPAFNNSIPL
jgi:hypothetical protein